MSLPLTADTDLQSRTFLPKGNLTLPQFFSLALLLSVAAIAVDQFAVPMLYSSSPLWALVACMGLVWRRGGVGFGQKAELNVPNPSFAGVVGAGNFGFSILRVALFVGAHGLILLTCKLLHETLGPFVGTFSFAGWVTAALKMSVLLPTLLLLPLNRWRILARIYAAEGVAALVVLFTFFPSRIAGAIWPWYGQVLGRMVFFVSGLLAPGLTLGTGLTPTIHGPDLDVTILFSCSGISGVELFDYLFAMVVFVDWNRLRRGRALFVYFAGIAGMLAGNGLRIVSFVVLGNRGFADSVSRFHLSAGWLFFSAVFLAYLSLTYHWILEPAGDRN